MKALLICAHFPPTRCGVGDYTEQLVRHLDSIGVDVWVITSKGDTLGDERILRIIKGWGPLGGLKILWFTRKIKPHIIHIQYHGDDFGGGRWIAILGVVLRVMGYRLITTLHNLQGSSLLWCLLRVSERLILTNDKDLERLSERFPFSLQKAIVIPAGPGTPKKDSMIRRLVAKEETVISYYGFINQQKGIETLLYTLRGIIDDGYKVRLLMIGDLHSGVGDGHFEYKERIKGLTEELGIDPYVVWTGYVTKEEASSYLVSSDICVLPFLDGASTKRSSLISCLHHGLPVITTLDGTPPEGMEDHKNLIFIRPGDVEGLEKAIIELINDKDLRARLGKEAEELVNKRYTWERITKRIIEIYEDLLSG